MTPSVATVIGDVVGSRATKDRAALHRAIRDALDQVNAALGPVTPMWVTAGDEYQGCFSTVGEALQATLRLTVALREVAQVRHGIGWGPVRVLEEGPLRVEDGPGWWAARAAIEEASAAQRRPASRGARTRYVRAPEAADGTAPEAVNAALALRDQLLHGLGPQALSVVAGMLAGMSQKQIAATLAVSPSAVSQRVRRDGLAVLLHADELLGRVP